MENIIAPVITEKIKGIIYKLYNKNDENIFYIGSSTKSLYVRTHQHKRASKKGTNKLYTYIRDNEGIENFISEVIETVDVDNIRELRQKEQYYLELLKPTLNSHVASTNININYKNNPSEYRKKYIKTLKGAHNIKQYNNTEKHKEYIKIYSSTEKSKEYRKNYRIQHAAKIKDYHKDYNQNHRKVKLN
jgi:hypothetical protein